VNIACYKVTDRKLAENYISYSCVDGTHINENGIS
jgi:hypothetical protein